MDLSTVPRGARARAKAIVVRLAEIDAASVRPARAVASGYGTTADEQIVTALEAEARTLRAELRPLLPPYPAYEAPSLVPVRVTARQAQLCLLQSGYLQQVQAVIDALPPAVKAAAQITWDKSLYLDRDNPMLASLAATIGLTDTQIDALFIQAAAL